MARSALSKYRLPVASILLAAAAAGCDNEQSQADKKVAKQLHDASFKSVGKIDPKAPKTIKDYNDIAAMTDMSEYSSALATAAQESNAGPLEQIEAKTLQAHDELRAAMEKANEAARTSAEIDKLSLQIVALSTRIHSNSTEIARLNLADPKKVAQEWARVSEMTTGAKGAETWVSTPSGKLASQAGVDKRMAEVKSTIESIQSSIDTDEKLRADAAAESDKFSQQAEAVQGPRMVDLVKMSADDRQKASDLSTKIDQSKVKLLQANQDLDALKAQRDVAVGAADQYDQAGQSVQKDWKAIQDQAAKVKAQSQAMLGNDSDPATDPTNAIKIENGGDTIASKMALIQKLATKNKKIRSEAQGHFISAVKFYSDAYAQANKLKSDLSTLASANAGKPNVDAWEAEQEAIAPLNYLLYRGNADLDLATFLSRGAEEDLSIKRLAATVNKITTDSALTQPTVLNGIEEPNPKAVSLDALKHFTSATADLKQVYEAQGTSRKVAAHSMSMYAQYEWYLFDTNSGAEDEKAAGIHLQLSKDAVKALGGENTFFTKLPPELAESAPTPPATPGGTGTPAAPAATPGATGDTPGTPAPTGFGSGDANQTVASVAGSYSFSGTDPKHADKSGTEVLVLSPDGTFTETVDQTMKGPPTMTMHAVAAGSFTVDTNGVKTTVDTINGKPPPAQMNPSALTTVRKITDGGKTLVDADTSDAAAPPLTKKE